VRAGGVVVNGSTADLGASISGASNGVRIGGGITNVTNYANITATGAGIRHAGVLMAAAGATVDNLGAITAPGAQGAGIQLTADASVTNGGSGDLGAVISGGAYGVRVGGAGVVGTLTNFGTVSGAVGVGFGQGAQAASGTVVNAGSIISTAGTAGVAIRFGSGANRLVLDPGATFVGHVLGGSGSNILELAAGSPGTFGAIGSIGPGAEFERFDTLAIDPGANWMTQGRDAIGTIANDGTLSVNIGSTLTVGTVDPTSNGEFAIVRDSVLRLGADTGSADRMRFLDGGTLVIEHAAQFGPASARRATAVRCSRVFLGVPKST
jgi:hypothetical protein